MFRHPDFNDMKQRIPLIFDGRNLYEPVKMRAAGFCYFPIGRPAVIVE